MDFQTHPDRYRHWKLTSSGALASLEMDVSEDGAAFPGYELKLNSYDIGVDIELYDAIQRLRFEHPEVKVEEGVKGRRAVGWRLVDETVPGSQFAQRVAERAEEMSRMSDRPDTVRGVQLTPLSRTIEAESIGYDWLDLSIDRNNRNVTLHIRAPDPV